MLLNKTDLHEEGVTKEDFMAQHNMRNLMKDPRIFIQPCSFKDNTGVNEGLDWLAKSMVAL